MGKAHQAVDKCYKTKLSTPDQWAQMVLYDIERLVGLGVGASTDDLASADATSVDLSKKSYMPAVLSQGQLGSCSAHAVANCIDFMLPKEGLRQVHPSRLALYYNCRVLVEGSPPDQDTGVVLTDMCSSITQYHFCDESLWPYDVSKFSLAPPKAAVLNEQTHLKFESHPLEQDLNVLKHCLLGGYPFIFGIQVFESFESEQVAESGDVPLPEKDEQNLGGHALCSYGFDDTRQAFLVLNSWGPWGYDDSGYCWIPYSYLTDPNLASDFHVATVVS